MDHREGVGGTSAVVLRCAVHRSCVEPASLSSNVHSELRRLAGQGRGPDFLEHSASTVDRADTTGRADSRIRQNDDMTSVSVAVPAATLVRVRCG